jgi:hypothetical protein
MTLGIRKLLVVGLVAAVIVLGNFMLIASWLQEVGAVDIARTIRQEFLTGTAVTILVALLILLVDGGRGSGWTGRRCRVCERRARARDTYCADCGSRL